MPLTDQTAAELEGMRQRLLEMLVPLAQERQEGSMPTEDEDLRQALWSAAHALYPLLRDRHVADGIDLNQKDEATGQLLYRFVVFDYFTPRTIEDVGDISVPRHTPEECGLHVFFNYGRWFVTWLYPDRDSSQPEAVRHALFVFDKDANGTLYLTDI